MTLWMMKTVLEVQFDTFFSKQKLSDRNIYVKTCSVLIVRHPFVRLISSWNEKYSREHKHAMHYYKTSRNFTHYNHDEWNKDDDQTHLMSFKDFIYWLALTSNDKNPHFAPQTKMCKPCQNFNYMIKVSERAF